MTDLVPASDNLPPDPFDDVLAAWGRALPGLDLSGIALSVRITRMALLFDRAAEELVRPHGFGLGELEVMFCLLNAGKPYEQRPSDLTKGCFVTSGAMTGRVDRLTKLGLVKRIPSLVDRREMVVRLTPAGEKTARQFQLIMASDTPLTRVLQELPDEQRAALDQTMRFVHSRMQQMIDNASDAPLVAKRK